VTTAVRNAIRIATNGVTLDLCGFTISSTVAVAANGGSAHFVEFWFERHQHSERPHSQRVVTNNGGGIYSGSGFASGIFYSLTPPVNISVVGVSVSGCRITASTSI